MSEVSSKPRNLGCVRGYFIRVCSEWGDRQFEFLPTRWYTIPVYQMHNVIYKESREKFVYVRQRFEAHDPHSCLTFRTRRGRRAGPGIPVRVRVRVRVRV